MEIITSRPLSRRTVLRGAGAALALPFLDAMSPARLSANAKSAVGAPHRFQAVYVPNGMAMEYWTPQGVGRDFELPPILQPMAAFKDQMIVLSGVNANWVNIHNGASGAFLTGATRGGRNETEFLAATSMDQLLAQHFSSQTQLASLELSMDPPPSAGVCSGGLSCTYLSTISWRTPTQPLPMESNPRAVFERLFGDTGTLERSAREARLHQKKSILDYVNDKLGNLRREIGPTDQLKLEEYTEAVRDVERRIQAAEAQIDLDLPNMQQPQGIPADFEEHMDLMFDLQVMALQTDMTRVITFMMSREISARPYPQIGVPEAHHPLSHHNDRPDLIAHMSKINVYHATLFSKYLAKLRATPDGDGNLLDNTTILYGCGISNSTRHSGVNLPLLLLGGGAGTLRTGRHVQFTESPGMANLLVTLMDKLSVPVERIGGSNGKVDLDTLNI
jgi:hypothetical protein